MPASRVSPGGIDIDLSRALLATSSYSSADGFVPFDGSIKGSWWQLNGGLTWELDKNTSFYANVGYQKGFDSRGFHAWDGKVGFRWNR